MLIFICCTGEENIVNMVSMDKGLAFKCLKDRSCDTVVEVETDKGWDEIERAVLEGRVGMTLEELRSTL